MLESDEASSNANGAGGWQTRDFLPVREATQAVGTELLPLPWVSLSQAECWLLAIKLHRATRMAPWAQARS